jgi:hypothetical protein
MDFGLARAGKACQDLGTVVIPLVVFSGDFL